MRSARLPFVGIFLLLALVLSIAILVANREATSANSSINLAPTNVVEPPGAPAITPHTLSANSTNTTPAITETDVSNFVATRGFVGGEVVPGAKIKIIKIQFLTAKELSTLLGGEDIGRPDNALVCYVEVQGPFQLTHAHLPPPSVSGSSMSMPITRPTGIMVFDAITGNLLLWAA